MEIDNLEFAEVLSMKIEFRQAAMTDAELLVEIYNASFYNDNLEAVEIVNSN